MNRGLADKNNRLATLLLAALAGLAGSAVTIITAVSMVWAILSIVGRRFRLSLDRPTVVLSLAALAYVLADVLSAMVNLPGSPMSFGETLVKLAPLALFLSPLFLVARLRLSRPEDLLSAFVLGASFCGILALPLAAYQVFHLGLRAEGGAGNAIPFAMLSAFFSVISLLNCEYPQGWRKVLGWVGFAAGVFALFLSKTKGVAVIPLTGVFVYLAVFRMRRVGLARVALVLVVVCVAMAGASYVSGALDRLEGMSAILEGELPQGDESSYGPRLALWKAGLEMIAAHPVLGNGPQNIRSLIETTGFAFSHFHNGYVTAAVGGGILGLITLVTLLLAPLVLCFQARQDSDGPARLYIAAMLVLTYMLGGMTNFIFGHDIYDSVFLFTASLCIASIGRPEPSQTP